MMLRSSSSRFRRKPSRPKIVSSDQFTKEFNKLKRVISITDIKKSLQSSNSEARFYTDISKMELNRLLEEKQRLDAKIQQHYESMKGKEIEGSKVVQELWERTKKINEAARKRGDKLHIKPHHFKKVLYELKKLSKEQKMKGQQMLEKRKS
ncbi:unnamed protein product [Acanthoscelides obtectus]|uniref:Uncharacterized protein n=1 Tax=Acanthoscelides obtectus TaxID=200917 RepID=A0A9P0NYV0_ACAOB|nr:unnamed protein product [Acanthoscelides obtectus]CAK1668464.1 hypothetical protein AOBTE_LOCUS26417 [Acanthoscelides obtectus]